MSTRFRMYVLVLFFLVVGASAACGSADSAALTLPATAQRVSLAAEPNAISPEFLPGSSCFAKPPFDLRFVLRLDGGAHVVFRRLRFRFQDSVGATTLPQVALGSSFNVAASSPAAGPIPVPSGSTLPSASPIPTPGSTPLQGMTSSFGSSQRLPVALRLPCGIAATGTLIVIVDFDDRGRAGSFETRVPVR